jgi:hypothetical protein
MSETKPAEIPSLEEAFVDIRALAPVYLESADPVVMEHDFHDPDDHRRGAASA